MTIIFVLGVLGLVCLLVSAYRLREYWVMKVAWMYGHPNRLSEDPITYWMIVGVCVVGAVLGAVLTAASSYILVETYL